MKKLLRWIFVFVLLVGMSGFFAYRLTLQSMGAGYVEPENKTVVSNRNINTEFKKIIKYNPVAPPEHTYLKKLQHEIFYTTPQIRAVRSSISILHQELDYKLRPEAVLAMKANKNAEYWQGFTGSPTQVGNDTAAMITRIENIIMKLKYKPLLTDLKKTQSLLMEGTEKQDVLLLWQAHKIIHDLDYFLINYPVTIKTGEGALENSPNGPKQYWGATTTIATN